MTTDFSPESEVAFSYARELAAVLGADRVQITLLTVLEDLVTTSVQFDFGLAFIDTAGLMENAAKHATEKVKKSAEKHFSGMNITTEVIQAKLPVFQEIINFGQAQHVDYIILATHGRTGVKHLLLGSVAERVIRGSHCPVLVVPIKR